MRAVPGGCLYPGCVLPASHELPHRTFSEEMTARRMADLEREAQRVFTDPLTGGRKGVKDAQLGAADALALEELAKVYGFGGAKYERYNYLRGYPWSLSVDALYRHLLAFLAGEDRDPESGLLHTAHVAWHALALTSFTLRELGTDDRAPR